MAAQGPLAPAALAARRTALLQDIADGRRRQIVLPQALFATFLVSVVWIAIPHINRPWLYRSRWLVVTLVLALNYEQATRASSTNAAWSIVSGLMATYGSMLCLQHLIFTHPQRDAARAVRVSRGSALAATTYTTANYTKPPAAATSGLVAYNGTPLEPRASKKGQTNSRTSSDCASSRQGEEDKDFYVWQRFPAEAPFFQRLAWATDLVLSFRGAGWNTSVSVLPKPNTIGSIKDGQRIDLRSIPSDTSAGYRYISSPSAFLSHRLKVLVLACLMLDFIATYMMKDPYFVFGRENAAGYPLPWYLADLPAWCLEAYRQLFSISGAFAAVAAAHSLSDVAEYYIIICWFPYRNVPWMYASAFGSLSEVLNRGLGGFWGSLWHQTFRQQFLAPATFLLNHGFTRKGTLMGNAVALLSTFGMSGLLHASGSLSTMSDPRHPDIKLWRQPVFFLLQGVGILVQQSLASAIKMLLPRAPAALRRSGNAVSTLLWLYATAWLFNDDMAAMGAWLVEPVPVSVFRALGFGFPGDAILRWDSHYLFRWNSGRHWWESGVAV